MKATVKEETNIAPVVGLQLILIALNVAKYARIIHEPSTS